MKTFQDICRMTQKKVKDYMKEYLASQGYAPVSEDGFLYAKGDVPVLLVAHMDTVHKQPVKEVLHMGQKISSPQGIGGDDRCGIFIIANIVKELKCSVLLCEDEEVGAVGANKFKNTEYIKSLDVNFMIEFDRKGNSDAVFYNCGTKEFHEFVEKHTGFVKAHGSFSDISVLMPAAQLCGVNLSSGYYKAHTTEEYVLYDEMMHTITKAKELIKAECEKPFKYEKEELTRFSAYDGFYDYDWYEKYRNTYKPTDKSDNKPKSKTKNVVDMIRDDIYLELEVVALGVYGTEEIMISQGATKAECWMNLFVDNPDLCMNDILDYSFM